MHFYYALLWNVKVDLVSIERPPGPIGTGDSGHGRGLMQIDDRSHGQWLMTHNWQDPETNITYGGQILASNMIFLSSKTPVLHLTDGSVVTVSSNQAAERNTSAGNYTDPRPLINNDLIKASVSSYNTGCGNVLISVAVGVDSDFTTTPGPSGGPDYGSDVIRSCSFISSEVPVSVI